MNTYSEIIFFRRIFGRATMQQSCKIFIEIHSKINLKGAEHHNN